MHHANLLTLREWVRAGDAYAEPEDKHTTQQATGREKEGAIFVVTYTELSQMNGTGEDCSVPGAAPPNRWKSTAIRWMAVSGLCHNRGEENNWHLLNSYLIFS